MDAERFRAALVAWAAGGTGSAAAAPPARGLMPPGLRTVVLVEGVSDQVALEALATRRRWDLDARGVSVVPMGGAMSIRRYLRILRAHWPDLGLRGLCDVGEESHFRRGLEESGLGVELTRTAMEALGFYVCVADLEDELIRALGAASVQQVVAAEGHLRRFRGFENQPAQRGKAVEQQLRRFMGTTSGRKARYARALALELDPDRVPRPLDGLLASL
jgi:hypothetical protein